MTAGHGRRDEVVQHPVVEDTRGPSSLRRRGEGHGDIDLEGLGQLVLVREHTDQRVEAHSAQRDRIAIGHGVKLRGHAG